MRVRLRHISMNLLLRAESIYNLLVNSSKNDILYARPIKPINNKFNLIQDLHDKTNLQSRYG